MDLSAFKGRNGSSWKASKLATIACFLATGAILTTTLLEQNGFVEQLINLTGQLF
jgi:hypothetical protein